MQEKRQFEMHFPSDEESAKKEAPAEKKLFSDWKIRKAVEKDGENIVFGNMIGKELHAFGKKCHEIQKTDPKNYYRIAARQLYDDPLTGYARRFADFETFLGVLTKSHTIMKNEEEIEIAKREVEEEQSFKEAKKNKFQDRDAA